MYRTTRLKLTDINPHLKCVLCGGYFVDATTIIECLHSFCRTCILRYLETSKFCPICDVMIHKTRPATNIRADKTLQDLVYKLVPGLYKNEMKRRREYYVDHPPNEEKRLRLSPESLGNEAKGRVIYTEDERISVSLQLSTSGLERSPSPDATFSHQKCDVRYLQCPAAVTVAHMKKFVRMKYDLSPFYKIDIFHADEALKDDLTLMDIAYIYTWRRRGPLKLYYSVYENGVKRLRLQCTEKELSDGSKPTQQSLEAGPSVVEGDASKTAKVDSTVGTPTDEKVESITKTSEKEKQKDRNLAKKSEHTTVNGKEKTLSVKASENKRPSNGVAVANSQEEPGKNNKSASEIAGMKQELTADKDTCPKGKDRVALPANNIPGAIKKGAGNANGKNQEKTPNIINGQTSKDKSDFVGNGSNLKTNGVDNVCRNNCIKTLNGKITPVTNGNTNGISNKLDTVVISDKPLSGFIFSKPANVKDKTQAKSIASQRKLKQPKRSLDDTVAKCKARELALQATTNQQTISNGGPG